MNLIYNELQMDQALNRGDYLVTGGPRPNDSPQFHYAYLTMQEDGNLVLYRRRDRNSAFEPIWNSGTAGTDASRCVLRRDGNLVVVNDQNVGRWATGVTRPHVVQAFLHLFEVGVGGATTIAYIELDLDGEEVWRQGDPYP